MEQNWRELKVLVLVKTYPRPSQHHQEVVCTAGMKEEGKWIRLYPINYRYRPYTQWFRKYEWIKVVAVKHSNDPRPESYRPDPDKPIETVSHLPADRDRTKQRNRAQPSKHSSYIPQPRRAHPTRRMSIYEAQPGDGAKRNRHVR